MCQQAEEQGIAIPDLMEDKQLLAMNWQQSFSYAVNLNNQIQVNVPMVMQHKQYTFTEMASGTEFIPPQGYDGLFHPEGTITGLGDAQVSGQHYWFLSNLVIGTEAGLRLPTGSRKFDEYSLLEYHQPLTSGTVIPTGRVIVFSRGDKQGVLSNLGAQIPVMENTDGYRFGSMFSGDVGYWRRYQQKSVMMGQVSVQHENAHQWNSATIPYSHRTFVRVGAMFTHRLNDNIEGMLRVDTQVMRKVWSQDDAMETDVLNTPVFNVGVTWL